MKRFNLLLTFALIGNLLLAQHNNPSIVIDSLYSAALENAGGENPTRRISIYLPHDYEENIDKRYPVIYYLHGFTSSDSTNLKWFETDKKLSIAFENAKIRPFILVVANQYTLYRGSFYTNSSLTGNWADFTARDLVNYIDQKYRTIPHRNSRGICGWSMGGYGAIKMGMLYPETFSCVYAMSPAMLTLVGDYGARGVGFKRAQEIQNREDLLKEFPANVMITLGRTFSPNPEKPPFYADLPFSWIGDSLVTHYDVLEKWNNQLPINMIDDYLENFNKLKAFKMDWGRNDQFIYLPVTCRMFSEKLENFGVEHYAEEYIGTHSSKLWSPDGRMINNVLPFFDSNLEFEE